MSTTVDVATLDLIENALLNARFEMDEVVRRAAMSPTIRVQHDEFPMICNADGQMVVGQFGSYIPEVIDRFGDAHRLLYGFVLEGGAEVVNLRVVATGRVPVPELEARPDDGRDASSARTGTQKVWTPDGTIDVPTYARAELEPGMTIEGYAIVEQYDATTVVLPGHHALVDPWMNLLITPEEESR